MSPWWLTALIFAGSYVASELLKPRPDIENARAGVDKLKFPTATEARKVPLLWGTRLIKGANVVWYGDVYARPMREEVQINAFQSQERIVSFEYTAGMQIALCRGPDVQATVRQREPVDRREPVQRRILRPADTVPDRQGNCRQPDDGEGSR